MVITHRQKNRRQRGSRTCGWGLCHRGHGQKGGAGNSGYYQTKKPSIWKEKRYGKIGFTPHGISARECCIDLKTIQHQLPLLIKDKKATAKGDLIHVNLKELGYTKLLSTGKVNNKLHLTISRASASALEKVKSSGGEVIIDQPA